MSDFRVGTVISRSFSIWAENFVPFMLLIAGVFCAPVFAFLTYFGSIVGEGSTSVESIGFFIIVAALGIILLYHVVLAAVIYGVVEQLRGRRPSMGACISVGLGRLLSVLGVSVLISIAMAFVYLCLSFIAVGLGYPILIIPGIFILGTFITCMVFVAVPVAVMENLGGDKALERSNVLTNGYKVTIVGVIVVLGLISAGMSLVHEYFLSLLPDMVATIVALGGSAFFMALSSVTVAIVYHELRLIKDGAGAEVMARGFE